MSRQKAGNAVGEIAKPLRKLPLHAASILTRIPTANIGERCLHANIRLQLNCATCLMRIAEFGIRIIHACSGFFNVVLVVFEQL